MESYYASIDNSEYENAYEIISKEIKEDITEE